MFMHGVCNLLQRSHLGMTAGHAYHRFLPFLAAVSIVVVSNRTTRVLPTTPSLFVLTVNVAVVVRLNVVWKLHQLVLLYSRGSSTFSDGHTMLTMILLAAAAAAVAAAATAAGGGVVVGVVVDGGGGGVVVVVVAAAATAAVVCRQHKYNIYRQKARSEDRRVGRAR